MVIQKIEMTSGQPVNFRESIVHALSVDRPTSVEKCILVTEITVLGTSASNHNGIGYEVSPPLYQIAAERRHPIQRPSGGRSVNALRAARTKVCQECWKGLLARAKKNDIGMGRRFV